MPPALPAADGELSGKPVLRQRRLSAVRSSPLRPNDLGTHVGTATTVLATSEHAPVAEAPCASTTSVEPDLSADDRQWTDTITDVGLMNSPARSDTRMCRLCLDENDDDDQGRLLAPCHCRGTARYIHAECLRSWREVDRKNSFYACGLCGARYRFRSTLVTRMLGRRHAAPGLAVLLLLLASAVVGFLADPLLRFADADALGTTEPREVRHHVFDEHLVAADGIREAVSTVGYLFGDCTWASPREAVVEKRLTNNVELESGHSMEVFVTGTVRAERTKCAERWGREKDDEVRADVMLRVGMYVVKGLATLSWAHVFASRLFRQWVLLAITCCMILPRIGRRLPANHFTDLRSLGCSFLGDLVKVARVRIKRIRRRGEIVHPAQLALNSMCILSLWVCYNVARDVSKALVKRALADVEDHVLDAEESAEREKVQ